MDKIINIAWIKEKMAIKNKYFFLIAVLCVIIGLIWTLAFYKGAAVGNYSVFYLWLCSIIFIIAAFFDCKDSKKGAAIYLKRQSKNNKNTFFFMIMVVTIVYFFSHLRGYSTAPWNDYGLFDDAAWDIYDAEYKCFNGNSFEIIFWDEDIGRISRELLFHYYISILFRIFGYNMRVFNIGLILLGYITVLFTTLVSERLFKNKIIASTCGIMLNYFPIHFTQVFMGHRYAMCTPMMMVSFYFILLAVQEKKTFFGVIGGVFAGFTMESAIMGKQYIWSLLGTAAFYLFFWRKDIKKIKEQIPIMLSVIIGYAAACFPLYAYIWTHSELYRIREAGLTEEFFSRLNTEGFSVIQENVSGLMEVLFAPQCGRRQFSSAFPILPWYLAIAAFIGIGIALYRKWFWLILMVAIPVAGNCITTTYDFRLLIAAPSLAIMIVLALDKICGKIINNHSKRNSKFAKAYIWIVPALTFVLLLAPIKYIHTLRADSDSQWFLRHNDLAASRYIQDVAAGAEAPNYEMKSNEFSRNERAHYDLMAATKTSYAHVHAFLGPDDSHKILSLFGDFPYVNQEDNALRSNVRMAIENYEITGKDLVLALEYDPRIEGIIEDLKVAGAEEVSTYTDVVDSMEVTMLTLRVDSASLSAFKQAVLSMF